MFDVVVTTFGAPVVVLAMCASLLGIALGNRYTLGLFTLAVLAAGLLPDPLLLRVTMATIAGFAALAVVMTLVIGVVHGPHGLDNLRRSLRNSRRA